MVALYASPALRGEIDVVHHEPRWHEANLAGLRVHNLYGFSASGTSTKRAQLFRRVQDRLLEVSGTHIIAGDTNSAPREVDGRNGDATSKWVGVRERAAWHELADSSDLVDLAVDLREPTFGVEYTIIKRLPTGTTRFRTDLMLMSRRLLEGSHPSFRYDHSVREGVDRFTDHSALITAFDWAPPETVEESRTEQAVDSAEAKPLPSHRNLDSASAAGPTTRSAHVVVRPERTAIRRQTASTPTRKLVERAELWSGMKILDFGCGYGADADWLKSRGVIARGYDPSGGFGFAEYPVGDFDAVLLNYVVNVLPTQCERFAVIREAWRRVAQGGFMLVVSRSASEIDRNARIGTWPHHNNNYLSRSSRGTFQCGHSVAELVAMVSVLDDATASPWPAGSGAAAVLVNRQPCDPPTSVDD